MLKKIFVIATLLLLVKVTFAQNRSNNIDVNDLQITLPGSKSVIQINSTQDELIKAFGQPLKIEDYYFEMDEKKGVVVKYKGANFYFIDGKLEGFDFTAEGTGFLIKIKGNQAFTGIDKSVKKLKKLRYFGGGAFYNVQSAGKDRNELLSFEIGKNGHIKTIIYTSYDANQELNTLRFEDLQKPFDL